MSPPYCFADNVLKCYQLSVCEANLEKFLCNTIEIINREMLMPHDLLKSKNGAPGHLVV